MNGCIYKQLKITQTDIDKKRMSEAISSGRLLCSYPSLCRVQVQPFVIAWLDSNVAFDTRDSRLICGSLGFLCRYCHYFVSRHADYLHQGALAVQILGVILSLIPGTSKCTRMLPRLVRSIYWMQVNCVTDLGNYCPPLSRSHREGILRACCVRFPSCRSSQVKFHFIIVSISSVCALRSNASGFASWVGYLVACPLH